MLSQTDVLFREASLCFGQANLLCTGSRKLRRTRSCQSGSCRIRKGENCSGTSSGNCSGTRPAKGCCLTDNHGTNSKRRGCRGTPDVVLSHITSG